MNTNKKGFSLIELSIVLIIIGLLVAGITGGASLIRSAKLRSVMTEVRNNQTAVNAYYTATEDLPGTDGTTKTMAFVDSCTAWANLMDEGIIDVNLAKFSTTDGVTACTANATALTETDANGKVVNIDSENSPASKLSGAFYALGNNSNMNANVLFITADGQAIGSLTNPTTAASVSASITNGDAGFLDEKMDNGVIDSGKVQSYSTSAGTCAYDETSTSRNCATAISLGL